MYHRDEVPILANQYLLDPVKKTMIMQWNYMDSQLVKFVKESSQGMRKRRRLNMHIKQLDAAKDAFQRYASS